VSVYSFPIEFVAAGTPSSSPFLSNPVAANTVQVVRDVSGVVYPGYATDLVFAVSDPDVADYWFYAVELPTAPTVKTPFHWEGRVVMQPGFQVKIICAGGEFYCTVSGYELSNY